MTETHTITAKRIEIAVGAISIEIDFVTRNVTLHTCDKSKVTVRDLDSCLPSRKPS